MKGNPSGSDYMHNENAFFKINIKSKHYRNIMCKCGARTMLVNSKYILIVS